MRYWIVIKCITKSDTMRYWILIKYFIKLTTMKYCIIHQSSFQSIYSINKDCGEYKRITICSFALFFLPLFIQYWEEVGVQVFN